jgi:pyruvate ferredoxin oxidoreductase alpha subunit
MDRSVSFGAMGNGGPLWLELLAAAQLHRLRLPIVDYVYGLGGREITPAQIEGIYRDLVAIAETGEFGQPVTYLGVRGEEEYQSALAPARLAA